MAEKNYYILLEVKSNATADEIKSAYRLLAKKYHPDKNIGNKAAEEYFKEIQQAYAILSNPDKRKKYDLKAAYGTRTQAQQKNNSSGPQYTGNAYQYAQQQAQYQKQQQAYYQKQTAEKTSGPTGKKDAGETWQILVSVGIALVLLYFIISYSTEKTVVATPTDFLKESVDKMSAINAKEEEPAINNFDSPYSSFFGDEINESGSKNSISIFNSSNSEAVVCLIEKNAPNKVIRNQYMVNGSDFKMNEIPDGEYFLRVYYGSEWNPKKSFPNKTVLGGFKKENGFVEMNAGKDALQMKKEKKGTTDSYSTYEIHISPLNKENVKSITAEEFFTK